MEALLAIVFRSHRTRINETMLGWNVYTNGRLAFPNAPSPDTWRSEIEGH